MKRILILLLLLASSAAADWNGNGRVVRNAGLLFRRSITIDHTKLGSADVSNYTLLLSGTYDGTAGALDLRTVANGGKVQKTAAQPLYSLTVPADVIFTTDSGCTSKLSWEYETYSASSGAARIWIGPISSVSHSADTVIYICYDSVNVSTFQGGSRGAAWSANYAAIYHLPDGSTLNLNDSTAAAVNGTNAGATATSAQVDGGASFDGASGYVSLPSAAAPTGNSHLTLQAWINSSDLTNNHWMIGVGVGGSNDQSAFIITFGDGTIKFGAWGANFFSTHNWLDGTWHHVASVYDGATFKIYVDGALDGTGTYSTLNLGTGSPFLGAYIGGPSNYYNGKLDEVRINTTALTASQITAEYNNQNAPSGFSTIGSETPR
jgi:hypothetical protein